MRWLASETADFIPATIFSEFPKLNRVHDSVRDHEGMKAWYAKK